MNASLIWKIEIRCDGKLMGDPIRVTGWDLLCRLAAVKASIPVTWQAEAYPQFS